MVRVNYSLLESDIPGSAINIFLVPGKIIPALVRENKLREVWWSGVEWQKYGVGELFFLFQPSIYPESDVPGSAIDKFLVPGKIIPALVIEYRICV